MVPGLAGISGERYFFYILLKRMKLFVMLLLLGKVFSKKAVSGLFASAVSFLLGVFLTMAVMDQGMRGFLLGAAAVPHWGCYLLAVQFYTATDQAVIYGYGKRHALNLALVKMGAFFLVGCFAEAYLLPGILWKIWGNR